MKLRRKLAFAATIAVLGVLGGQVSAASAASAVPTPTSTHLGRPYAGDPVKEAAIVATENKRLYNLKAITEAARWRGIVTANPYIVNLDVTPTLVLVAAPKPYTIADLKNLIPSKFVGQPDGSYILSDNIVVESGAVLNLSTSEGATIRMTSSSHGFVSLVGFGGSLIIQGSSGKPITIESWDPSIGAVDSDTTDGRAYVRVIGGSAAITNAAFNHLGFWSGGTGGLALTGTQTSASDTAKASTPSGIEAPTPGASKVHGATIQNLPPAGTIDDVAAAIGAASSEYSYVTASIAHSSFDSDAYGLYVNGSQGVNVSDSTITNSLVDGIVFHRFVTNSTITNSSSNNNAVDGFHMTRASTGVIVKGLTTNNNGRDGISLDGGSLASGPNPAGIAVAVYGNNSVTGSTSNANGRNGITVAGGQNLTIRGNDLNNDFMGIVVSRAASKVEVTDNTIRNSSKHAISVLSGVSNSNIEANTLQGGDIAVYVRDSSASIVKNKISGVNLHGVTFTGNTSGSTVSDNHVIGSGPTAIDTARGTRISVGTNDVGHWVTTKPPLVILGEIFQPLTVLWCVLGLVLLISALSGIGRKYSGFRHPYADQVPLSSLTKGIATPAELGLDGPLVAVRVPSRGVPGTTASAPALALTTVHQ